MMYKRKAWQTVASARLLDKKLTILGEGGGKMYHTYIPIVVNQDSFGKERVLEALKQVGADGVALTLAKKQERVCFPDATYDHLAELITYYEENGIQTMVWAGETIGHDVSPCAHPDSGRYRNIRMLGTGAHQSICAADVRFLADCAHHVTNIARAGAKMILIDDDFRQSFNGNWFGCACEYHMSLLSEQLGEQVTEKTLLSHLFTGKKNRYRDAWLKVQGDTLRRLALTMRKALDAVNPHVRLGLCCHPGAFGNDGVTAIELATIMAGNTRPFLRTTGAPYWSVMWSNRPLGEIIEYERTQCFWCADTHIEVVSEGDTFPRPRYVCPASFLECFDMILQADGTPDGILKYALDYTSDVDYETGYLDAMVQNAPLYRAIREHFSAKKAVGFRPYNRMNLLPEKDFSQTDMPLSEESIRYPSQHFAITNNLPTSYTEGVNICFGENARYITQDELLCGNIIDLSAAKILMERGIDVGITRIDTMETIVSNGITDHLVAYYPKENRYVTLRSNILPGILHHRDTAEILMQYRYGEKSFPGVYRYQNQAGQRFLVYPFEAEAAAPFSSWFSRGVNYGWIQNYANRRLLIETYSWLAGKPLLAYLDGNHPYAYTLVKQDNRSVSVGVWNLNADPIREARIVVNAPMGSVAFLNGSGHVEGNTVVLDTVLQPYAFAGVVISYGDAR